MAKPLVFEFHDRQIAFSMSKVDRSKLYGYKTTEVEDEKGQPCQLATLAGDGKTVVGAGGVAMAYLSPDGAWCDRSELKPVDVEGKRIDPVASSFSAAVPLGEEASLEEYLDHNVRAVYLMESPDDVAELMDRLRDGAIFKFAYSFRGGLEPDAGFLLMGQDGRVYFAVGTPTSIEYVGLQQAAGFVDEDEAADVEEADLTDFDMI